MISLFRHQGIGAELRGESGARLGVSGYEVWVWVDARNEKRARELLRELADESDETLVVCPSCSESSPSHQADLPRIQPGVEIRRPSAKSATKLPYAAVQRTLSS